MSISFYLVKKKNELSLTGMYKKIKFIHYQCTKKHINLGYDKRYRTDVAKN